MYFEQNFKINFQMNTILAFKNLEEEDLEDHPCTENLREKMLDFHGSLMEVLSIESMEEEEADDSGEDPNARPSVWKTIVKVLYL